MLLSTFLFYSQSTKTLYEGRDSTDLVVGRRCHDPHPCGGWGREGCVCVSVCVCLMCEHNLPFSTVNVKVYFRTNPRIPSMAVFVEASRLILPSNPKTNNLSQRVDCHGLPW